MSPLALLLIVVFLVVLFGNPFVGPRVIQNYNGGFYPSGIAVVVAIIIVVLLLRR